jgi:hypothetical protein
VGGRTVVARDHGRQQLAHVRAETRQTARQSAATGWRESAPRRVVIGGWWGGKPTEAPCMDRSAHSAVRDPRRRCTLSRTDPGTISGEPPDARWRASSPASRGFPPETASTRAAAADEGSRSEHLRDRGQVEPTAVATGNSGSIRAQAMSVELTKPNPKP